jgi:hypothetical protein
MKLIPVAPVHGLTRFLKEDGVSYYEFYKQPDIDQWVALDYKSEQLTSTTYMTRTNVHSTNKSLIELVVDIILSRK